MGETKIEWADFTFNPWIGCTKVSPACDHCYAEGWAKRSGVVKWGAGEPRRRTTDANWAKPLAWNRAAKKAGVRRRVFCASLADVFDAEVPNEWRDDLFHKLICATPHLDWLVLTKRPRVAWHYFEPYRVKGPPSNVWLGTTVENQAMANLRIPTLLSIPARVHFLSCEPLLSAINLRCIEIRGGVTLNALTGAHSASMPVPGGWSSVPAGALADLPKLPPRTGCIDWVIAGGESGPHARPSHPDWFRSLRDQCQAARVPFFFKQWGEWAPVEGSPRMVRQGDCFLTPEGSGEILGPDLGTELEDCGTPLRRIGKARAGALLDGREWREFPGSTTRRD